MAEPPTNTYAELRDLAHFYLSRERSGHTLQPTALVHEALIRMRNQDGVIELDRADMVSLAARTMRHVLVDHARRKKAQKRGDGRRRVDLDEALVSYEERSIDLLALHDVLERLGAVDPRMTRIIDLRFFGGLSEQEVADILGVSATTIRREWRLARNWLFHALGREDDGPTGAMA